MLLQANSFKSSRSKLKFYCENAARSSRNSLYKDFISGIYKQEKALENPDVISLKTQCCEDTTF